MKIPGHLLLIFLLMVNSKEGLAIFSQNQGQPIIFIYDASGSMWGAMDGRTKVEIAREVLIATVDKLPPEQPLGLVAYGHRKEGDCTDVEYLSEPGSAASGRIKEQIEKINPLGRTPLAHSASMVIDKLKNGMQATIILITDGIESCGGDLCQVIQNARNAGIDFRLHIVGFGLNNEDRDPLRCAAQSANGNYFEAQNAGELHTVLNQATSQTIDDPHYNLTLYTSKNQVPVDAWVKIFQSNSKIEISGTRTYRDTGYVSLPAGTYDLEIHPLENSDVKAKIIQNLRVEEGKKTSLEVSFDAGKISVLTLMNGENQDATVRITRADQNEIVSGGRTYAAKQFYDLTPGIYDLELTCLKIYGTETVKNIQGIEVKPGDTTQVEYNFVTGLARIGVIGESGLMDATINIVDHTTGKSVAAGRSYTSPSSNPKEFILTPGKYQVILVGVREFKGEKRTFDIEIQPQKSVEKNVKF